MDMTTVAMIVVLAVMCALYVARRRMRLGREDD